VIEFKLFLAELLFAGCSAQGRLTGEAKGRDALVLCTTPALGCGTLNVRR
jgi:hypothetical protein